MKIIPIAGTSINWELFVSKCNSYLGRSPTRNIDGENLPVGTLLSFMSALDSLSNRDSDPYNPPTITLNHVSLSFMMIMTQEQFHLFLENSFTDIYVIKCFSESKETILIATGTLREWKNLIINYKKDSEWTMKMWEIMYKLGFSSLFSEYKINSQKQIEKR